MSLHIGQVARRTQPLTGAMAAILVTFDGLAFTMSRIALLDIFQTTITLTAGCVMGVAFGSVTVFPRPFAVAASVWVLAAIVSVAFVPRELSYVVSGCDLRDSRAEKVPEPAVATPMSRRVH